MPAATIVATGPIALPYEKFADLLSQCPTFQTLLGVGSAALALAATDYPEWSSADSGNPADPEFLGPPVPGCLVTKFGGFGRDFEIRRGGISQGDLQVEFRAAIDTDYDDNLKDQLLQFSNTIGAIIEEAWARSEILVGLSQNIAIEEPVTEIEPPQTTDPDLEHDPDGDPFLIASYNFPWRL
jgi:hypothetical protein